MKRLAMVALTLLTSCTSSAPAARRVFVSEGGRHVVAFHSETILPAAVSDWYATAMRTHVPALRDAYGNVAVYVLRRDHDGHVTMTIISEWTSRDDLERCRGSGACSRFTDVEEVLFEALR